MGGSVSNDTYTQLAKYRAGLDPSLFFDPDIGGSITPITTDEPGYQTFSIAFHKLFPKPNLAERELPETVINYNLFKAKDAQVLNPYELWLRDYYIHIKHGFRVGIPYLLNAPHLVDGKNTMTVTTPPLRYHHRKNYIVDHIPIYQGTAILRRMLMVKANRTLSNDACNHMFDLIVKNITNTKDFLIEFEKEYQIVFSELKKKQEHIYDIQLTSIISWDPLINIDQSSTCDSFFPGQMPLEVLKVWGKKNHMKVTFPTLWHRYIDNLYGDGKKVDPDYAIIGFPRFHEEFLSSTAQGLNIITINTAIPSQEILEMTRTFVSVYYMKILQELRKSHSSQVKIIKDAHQWIITDKRWSIMNGWLEANAPHLLPYYYAQWGQFEAANHVEYLGIMGLLVFGHVSIWMHTPTGKSTATLWKDAKKESAIPVQPPKPLPPFQKGPGYIETIRDTNGKRLYEKHYRDATHFYEIYYNESTGKKANIQEELPGRLKSALIYDDNGRLVEIRIFDSNGILISDTAPITPTGKTPGKEVVAGYVESVYNTQGFLTLEKHYRDSTHFYEIYFNNGKKTSIQENLPSYLRSVQNFSLNGDLVNTQFYDSNGKLLSTTSENPSAPANIPILEPTKEIPVGTIKKIYNSNGHLLYEQHYREHNHFYEVYYDAQGKKTSIQENIPGGLYRTSQDFDSNGDMYAIRTFDTNGILLSTENIDVNAPVNVPAVGTKRAAGFVQKVYNRSGRLLYELHYREHNLFYEIYFNAQGKKTSIQETLADGTRTSETFDLNGKSDEVTVYDSNGYVITRIDPSWEVPPNEYKFVNPDLFQSTQMNLIREYWMQSHMNIIPTAGTDWVNKLPPSSLNNFIPPSNITSLPKEKYQEYVYQFMKTYPLGQPVTPSFFEDGHYRDLFGRLFNTKMSDSAWQTSCKIQWSLYLLWIEANINSWGKENYVKPGSTFPKFNDKGQPVINQCPNTGILAPYKTNDLIVTFLHIGFPALTFIFGDSWWKKFVDLLIDTFQWVLKFLSEYLPSIGMYLMIAAGVGVGALLLYDFIDESIRVKARK